MIKLSNLDAAFIHLETPTSPMHIGAVMCFSAAGETPMSLSRLKAHVSSRLDVHPLFRRRLKSRRLGLEYEWEEVSELSLDHHIRGLRYPGPLNEDTLSELTAKFFAQPLDRARPLWEILYIERKPDPEGIRHFDTGHEYAFVGIIKVHHAAVDGVSAEVVMTALLDGLPAPINSSGTTRGQANLWPVRLRHSATQVWARLNRRPWRDLPYYMQAPKTPFGVATIEDRQHICLSLPMKQLQAIKGSLPGATLNDVIVSVVGGGLRGYLLEQDKLPQQPLIAMTPVSRRADKQDVGGNQVSAMLIELATDEECPRLRLAKVHACSVVAKDYNQHLQIESLFASLPSHAVSLSLKAWTAAGLTELLPSLFNVIITNVPGSRQPLSLAGFPLEAMHGVAPVYAGHALTIVVLSYRDNVSLSLSCTRSSVTNPIAMRRHLQHAMEDLSRACGVAKPAVKVARTLGVSEESVA